jgi:hypothetical protein
VVWVPCSNEGGGLVSSGCLNSITSSVIHIDQLHVEGLFACNCCLFASNTDRQKNTIPPSHLIHHIYSTTFYLMSRIKEAGMVKVDDRIIEVGCGNGAMLVELAEEGFEVHIICHIFSPSVELH